MVDSTASPPFPGARLLPRGSAKGPADAHADVTVPVSGKYRLWVRYEYPAFCETRFRVVIEQGGKKVFDQVLGRKDSLRHAALSGTMEVRAQHDPPWGPEGLMEGAFTSSNLAEGKARI